MKRRALLGGGAAVIASPALARLRHGSAGNTGSGGGVGGGGLTITGISLRSASFTGGSSSGTVVGDISVTATGGSFSGSFSLTGTDASSFQIVGTSLATNGVVGVGSYAINIVATQSGAVGSPFSQAETITGTTDTIAAAFFPTTNVVGGDYIPISLRWTGTAPTSITSATWSGSGGSATVLSGSFEHTGQTVQCLVSTPSPGSTTSYNLSLTANTGASTTLNGISVIAPLVDLSPGIYGPSTVYYDGQGIGTVYVSLDPIAAYFTRGLAGALTATLTDTVGGSGDASPYYFSLSSKPRGWNGLTPGFNLCPNFPLNETAQTTFAVTINITNGISTLSLPITVHVPRTNFLVNVRASNNQVFGTTYLYNQVVLDSTLVVYPGTDCATVQLYTPDTGMTFTPDSSGLFSYVGDANLGTVRIEQADLIPANYGHHTCTVQSTSGPLQTIDLYIVATRPPVAQWRPNGSIYSSTRATTGFVGSNMIGTIAAYSDEHGKVSTSAYFRYEIVSDSSGVLQVWNDGSVYLSGPVSVGTIDAVVRITSLTDITHLVTLSLPVLAGVTLASSNVSVSLTPGLTNFVPYANPMRGSSTSFPYGSPVLVGTFTVSGFSNPIDWSNVQSSLPLGPTYDTAQEPNVGDPTHPQPWESYNGTPRYIIAGSGTSGTIHATNLSATDDVTPQVDTLRLQFTDGLGTYCTKDIPISVAWNVPSTPNVSVGPGGTFATPLLMGQAFWVDFNANGAASVYAGTRVKILPGCPVIAPNGFCAQSGGGSSTAGWMPYPLVYDPGVISQWTGNGTISGTTFTVNSTSSGAIEAGQNFTSGVGAAKVLIMSGSGSTWTVQVGPDPISVTLSVGPASMTTSLPRIDLDFARTAPGGSQQGALIKNGYDLVVYRTEFRNCTLGWGGSPAPGPDYFAANTNAAAIWGKADSTGSIVAYHCYFHDCDVSVFNGGGGVRVTMTDCMIAKCGNGQGTLHNVYTDYLSMFTFKRNQCNDTLVGLDFKTRCVQLDCTDNIFVDGPNGQGSLPVNFTLGGNMQFLRNIVQHACNNYPSRAGGQHQLNNEINGAQGTTGDSVGFAWPYQNTAIDSCTYINVVPRLAPFYASGCWTNVGAQLQTTTSYGINDGFSGDPLRNTPMTVAVTNTAIFDIPLGDYWYLVLGAVAGTMSGTNTSPPYPASAIRFIDPITGTPPWRLPKQGPFGFFYGGHGTSTIGSSPGVYYMSLTVPSGSSSGTNVIGGLLSGYDGNWDLLGSPSWSFNNDYTTDNASFTFSTTATGIQLKTSGLLADGMYTVTLQCVGTGWNSRDQFSGTITSISTFRVIVGNYT